MPDVRRERERSRAVRVQLHAPLSARLELVGRRADAAGALAPRGTRREEENRMKIEGTESLNVVITEAGRQWLIQETRNLATLIATLGGKPGVIDKRKPFGAMCACLSEVRDVLGLLTGEARPEGAQGVLLDAEGAGEETRLDKKRSTF
jgi:hypothetical protein